MKTRAYWIGRARAMYDTAAKMARIMTNVGFSGIVRRKAEERCREAIDAAGQFEDLALRTPEDEGRADHHRT